MFYLSFTSEDERIDGWNRNNAILPSHRTAEKSSSRFRHTLQNLRLNRDISDQIWHTGF